MSFKDIKEDLKPSYDTGNYDLVEDFYNKVLSESIKYDRISGFFNSTSLAVAAYGMSNFIKNNGHMRLLCSAELSEKDIESINNSDDLKDILDKKFIKSYEKLQDDLLRQHVKLLGWMVANNFLEIRIGIIKREDGTYSNGMLHMKKGILYDEDGESLSFNGSVNETAYGWKINVESFNVNYSWLIQEHLDSDINNFESYWNGNNKLVEVMDIPEATKKHLIKEAPRNNEELKLIEKIIVEKQKKTKPNLRNYQIDAINSWINNNYKGIFSMATGTGKTITALGCFDNLSEIEQQLITIVVCPQNHLLTQWEKTFHDFNYSGQILYVNSSSGWKSKYNSLFLDLELNVISNLVILTTFATFSNDSFLEMINLYDGKIFLIVDEVHGVGSFKYRKGLLDKYQYRLGLSATPEIENDFERTDIVFNYFGNVVYEYDLEKAIKNGFLCKYNYYPIFIDLNSDELEKYIIKTRGIASLISKKNLTVNQEKKLNGLIRDRKNIVDNAESKYLALKNFLEENKSITDLIIYCTGEQKTKVIKILEELNISYEEFIGEVSSKKNKEGISKRDEILELFSKRYFQVLIGIKCLDEGVDVPSTQTAFIMASTLNSRQHIQRRGRILRKHPNKKIANIYDLIVFPNIKYEKQSIRTIILNEQKRYDEFARLSENKLDCSEILIKKWSDMI